MPARAALEANEILRALEVRFRTRAEPIDVKFRELCSAWPWARRSDVFTHLVHPYSAKILSYIPILFLSSDAYVDPAAPVADVFAGTGTVLLESSLHPFYPRPAYGVELNPLARLIAQVKVSGRRHRARRHDHWTGPSEADLGTVWRSGASRLSLDLKPRS